MSRRSDAPKARRAPWWSVEQHARFAARKRYELALLLGKGDAPAGLQLLLACERQAEHTATLPAAGAAPARAPRKQSAPAADAAPAKISRQRRSATRSAKHHAAVARWRTLLVGVRLRAIRQAGHRLLLKAEVKRAPRALPPPAAADAAQPPTFVDAVRSTKTPPPAVLLRLVEQRQRLAAWKASQGAAKARQAAATSPAPRRSSAGSVGAGPEPRSAGKKSKKDERALRALATPESGVASGTASDVYSAGSESEWQPAPSRRRSAKMRRSGGAPHVR
jgi:hypothetical protein